MKRPVLLGILFVVAVLAVIIYSSMNLARYRYEVCMQYEGRTSCKTASGATADFAKQTAITGACAEIASGVTGTVACGQSTPIRVTEK
jgi:hypothetical protein